MRKFTSLLTGFLPAGLLFLAPFLGSCTSLGLTGSESYQYYGGWGYSHQRHFVPKEVRRVQTWAGRHSETAPVRSPGKPRA